MSTDKKLSPSEIQITAGFEKIHDHRTNIATIVKPFDDKIADINTKIAEMTKFLVAERSALEEDRADMSGADNKHISEITEDIRVQVLSNKKTCSTKWGTCTHVKGKDAPVAWDDAALNGVIAGAKGELDYILDFRIEGEPGKPHTRFKLKDVVVE